MSSAPPANRACRGLQGVGGWGVRLPLQRPGAGWAVGASCVGCCEEGGLGREGGAVWPGHSFLSLLCLPGSSVLPNGFEMKATAGMEDAVSMATGLSTARQLQSRLSGGGRCAEQPQSCLLPANEGDGRAGGKGGCLALPTLVPSLERRVDRALFPLNSPLLPEGKLSRLECRQG